MAPPIVKKVLVNGLLGLVGAFLVAYVADAIQVRIKLATGGPAKAYDSITIVYAAGLKNSKYEVYSGEPQTETCARSLFPQMGYEPCWYLRTHTMQMLD